MRYRLRTLLIALAIVPPLLGTVGVFGWQKYRKYRVRDAYKRWAEPEIRAGVIDAKPPTKIIPKPAPDDF